MKYSTLQYRAVFSFTRDAMAKGKISKGVFAVSADALKELCKTYLTPVGLRMKESKRDKGTISIERNDVDED
jgi:hypothetical protein